ncbi:hypothetical protein B0H13DRAFT_2018571 [Mycena leptocephala]|nr:hypothetical protein B0H13DRAFT_2018571 [Mycena leptocephala]
MNNVSIPQTARGFLLIFLRFSVLRLPLWCSGARSRRPPTSNPNRTFFRIFSTRASDYSVDVCREEICLLSQDIKCRRGRVWLPVLLSCTVFPSGRPSVVFWTAFNRDLKAMTLCSVFVGFLLRIRRTPRKRASRASDRRVLTASANSSRASDNVTGDGTGG